MLPHSQWVPSALIYSLLLFKVNKGGARCGSSQRSIERRLHTEGEKKFAFFFFVLFYNFICTGKDGYKQLEGFFFFLLPKAKVCEGHLCDSVFLFARNGGSRSLVSVWSNFFCFFLRFLFFKTPGSRKYISTPTNLSIVKASGTVDGRQFHKKIWLVVRGIFFGVKDANDASSFPLRVKHFHE